MKKKLSKIMLVIVIFFLMSSTNKCFAGWVEVFSLESNEKTEKIPIKSLKIKLDSDYIYLKAEYKKVLLKSGTCFEKGNESGVIDFISIFFDTDNNPNTPELKSLNGFEREVDIIEGYGFEYSNGESWKYISYSAEVKDYGKGKIGDLLYDSVTAEQKYVNVEGQFITVGIPRRYIDIKDMTKVRIGLKAPFSSLFVAEISLKNID